MNYNQPFRIEPNRVWRSWQGGRILDEISGAENPTDGFFPEDWIGSTTRASNPGREDITDEGLGTLTAADGQSITMDEFISIDPEAALGKAHLEKFGAKTELLVKLLDSSTRLHIQAHPSAKWATEHLGSSNGKTEAWWILNVRDGENGWVYLGFQNPPTPQQWKEIIDSQDAAAMESCFEKVPVKTGDVLIVQGGIPHAIGPGLLLLEVQEPTDYVVRCEYSHGGVALPESARTMGLGLDTVLDMFDYTAYPKNEVSEKFGPRPKVLYQSESGSETALLYAGQTDKLELRQIEVSGQFTITDDQRYSILIVLEGEGTLTVNDKSVELQKWSRFLLPASADPAKLCGNMKLARCMPPMP